MKITILGAGAYGTALGSVLEKNGHTVSYYDPKLLKISLAQSISGADYIILCVPSTSAPHILPHLPKDIPLIIATKGLLDGHLFRKFRDISVLSGPGFATDIKAEKSTYLTATDQRIVELFQTKFLHLDTTTDRKGVLICGSLKNVYAIYAGYQKLQKHSAPWQSYISKAAAEMKQILSANGANPDTVDLACGIGDLELTCDTPSRNYAYGAKLRENPSKKPENTVEGLTTLAKIKRGKLIIPSSASLIKEIEVLCH